MKWEEFRNSLPDTSSLEQFNKFLKDRADIIETYNHPRSSGNTNSELNNFNKKKRAHANVFAARISELTETVKGHAPTCEALVTNLRLCRNCLRRGHDVCRARSCRKYKRRHNSLISSNGKQLCPQGNAAPVIENVSPPAAELTVNLARDNVNKELEEASPKKLLSPDEKACEEHFQAHTTRDSAGRFCVRLPLKDSPSCLGNSYITVRKRFLNLEKRFRAQPELKAQYIKFISEYIIIGWDEQVPCDLQQTWDELKQDLSKLEFAQVPRLALCDSPDSLELHSFCDASATAHGCCLYMRSGNDNGQVVVRLLCAKSRVNPNKPTTIPRLELLGALLAARLCKSVLEFVSARFHVVSIGATLA
ncbi:unnamed protein product, partial [Brenthis ino]